MSVWMMPGQGAQKVGMGADLLVIPEVEETFELAQKATGIDLVTLSKEGNEEQVNDALNSQVLTSAISVGLSRALLAQGQTPEAIVGFSLGEISGLMVSGILSLVEGFALLNERSHALADACAKNPGAMLALLGATHEDAQAVCDACAEEDVLVCANFNSPGQVVVSGTVAAIDRAEAYWKEQSKRCSRLRTAGAFHSPLMQDAAARVEAFCETLTFNEPVYPLICNTDAKPFEVAQAVERLSNQVKSSVMFEQSISALIAGGSTEFIEVGFGGVLTNLVKRIDRGVSRKKIGTYTEWDKEVLQVSESDNSGNQFQQLKEVYMSEIQQTEQQVAIITGASRGIGAAIARALAKSGYDLALNHSSAHSAQACADLATNLKTEFGIEAMVCCADVSDFEAAKEMIDGVREKFGRIDVLVNNAGVTQDGLLARMSEEAFDKVISVNLKGAFNCMRHVAPIMMKQRSGRIVSISSVVGLYGNAGQVNYAASKAGIVGMTKSAAKELGARGITVNAVAPGFIDTDMTRALSDKAREGVASRIALRDLGTAEDVAAAVNFLVSKEARYITGHVLTVDGGLSL